MKFNCENCGTRYTLSDEKVKNRILKIRCKVCEDVIIVRDPARAASRPPSLAPAPVAEIEWYVSRDGGPPDGPMPLERIIDRIKSNKLVPADMVWNQSMTEWVSAEVALDAEFKAARATVPRPPLPSPKRPSPPKLPRLPGRIREPAPLLPKSTRKAAEPLAPKTPPKSPAPLESIQKAPIAESSVVKPTPALAERAASEPPAPIVPVAAASAPPAPIVAAVVSAPPAPIASSAPPAPPPEPVETDDSLDEPTQAMAADLGALLASMSGEQEEAARDTVALPASGLANGGLLDPKPVGDQADTLFAPAATASAAAAMQSNDTTLLPGIDTAPKPPSVTDWESLTETPDTPDTPAASDDLRLSDAGPSLPSSEPPPVVPEPDDDASPVVPAGLPAAAASSSITMTGEQFALAEGAFFGTGEQPAVASTGASAAVVSAPAGAYDDEEEGRSKLPLFIVLGVLLLGGGIALGVMFANDKGGTAPTTTASAASTAPKTEAPVSVAAVTDAPISAPPSDAPPSTPVSDAPSTAASVASAAPATKRPRRPASVASRAKPKTVKTEAPASKAPTTSTGRFASLGSQKPKDVSVASLKTEAPVELPETLSPGKISSVIRRYKKGLHGCYQRQLKRDSSMRKANLKLSFKIERSGRTSNIKIDRKYDGTLLKSCLNRLVRRWSFPQFTGEAIPVEYPLFFQASL